MDARHMGALNGTSGKPVEIISTRFGTLGSCWFYPMDQIVRLLRKPEIGVVKFFCARKAGWVFP